MHEPLRAVKSCRCKGPRRASGPTCPPGTGIPSTFLYRRLHLCPLVQGAILPLLHQLPSATARVHSWPHPAAREIVPRGTSDGLATLRKALQGPPLNSAPARCSRGDLASHAPLLSRVLANPVVSVLGPSQAAPRPQMWGVPLRPTESGRGLSVAPFLTPSGLFVRQPSPRRPLPSFRVLCRMYQLPT